MAQIPKRVFFEDFLEVFVKLYNDKCRLFPKDPKDGRLIRSIHVINDYNTLIKAENMIKTMDNWLYPREERRKYQDDSQQLFGFYNLRKGE